MSAAIAVRDDYDAEQLRGLAGKTRDASQARLLAEWRLAGMAKLYSIDLRERVAAFAAAHGSANLAAQTFSVSKATAVR